MPYVELIIAAIAGGGISSVVTSVITSWAVRQKIGAEAEEVEERIRQSVIESLQGHIDFLNVQIEKQEARIERQDARIQALEDENELLRKKNGEMEDRIERYEKDTGFHKVVT